MTMFFKKYGKLALMFIALLTIVMQLVVPTSIALQYEKVLKEGKLYRFQVVPIDPADPFKGRYVRLRFAAQNGVKEDLRVFPTERLKRKKTVYAVLEANENNIAHVRELHLEQPKDSVDYIKSKVDYAYGDKWSIRFPFNKYYANEYKAPKIEGVVRGRVRSEMESNVFAHVRVSNGRGVIEQLYVGEQTILDYLNSLEQSK